MSRTAYRLAARLVHRLPLPSGTLASSISGRREAAARWARWAEEERTAAPLAWVHGASVGEALAAEPVVARLRSARPDLQIVHSYSSPSAAGWPMPFAADHRDFLPLDEPGPVSQVLAAVRPSLMVFSRGDLWPEIAAESATRGIPLAVVGATVGRRSRRLHTLLRPLYGPVSAAVSWLGATSSEDAARWTRLGVPEDRVRVTGDPRHDYVLELVPNLQHLEGLVPWAAAGPVLAAGSVEPEDEWVLLGALEHVLAEDPDARALLVPHLPSEDTLARLAARAGRRGLTVERWDGGGTQPQSRVVTVAARGVLFDLYALAAAAYVGGGFRPGGLHATIEPAAYGIPVAVGPRWDHSDDARHLVEAGGAATLPQRGAGDALARVWLRWLEDAGTRTTAGLAARSTLKQGAAGTTARALLEMLPSPLASTRPEPQPRLPTHTEDRPGGEVPSPDEYPPAARR